ncbi:RHS repeat domain-containing protein [Thalassoglobus polymorphus]|uniref:RHS repeat domain-containing protein n=1 Tax=Thalassoglobus polymorphus TaxID=2527994 RepID=UPI00119D5F38|nr:RHS repeat domain-containing protein [Thalassoglobus polymorphus]
MSLYFVLATPNPTEQVGRATLPLNRRTTSAYDSAGRQTLRIDARGNRTTYSYDAASQLLSRRYPDGSRATFAYDATGNRTLLENENVSVTATYDSLNRRDDVTTDYKI